MLAETAADIKWEMEDGVEIILDPKLDGMRMVTQPSVAHTRKGKPIAASKEIQDNLAVFFAKYPTITLDGELYNHEYHADFQTLMKLFRKEKPNEAELEEMLKVAEYHIYDMFDSANPDMTCLERKQWLDNNLKPLCIPKVFVVEWQLVSSISDYKWALDKNLEDGYEGSIVRIPWARYINKRSKSLIKIKIFNDAEYTIEAILPGKGNRGGIAGSVVVNVDGALVGCGIRGTRSYFKDLLDGAKGYVGLKATVRFFGFTDEGKLRFPVVVDINRPD
jgi:DNA ligase-1